MYHFLFYLFFLHSNWRDDSSNCDHCAKTGIFQYLSQSHFTDRQFCWHRHTHTYFSLISAHYILAHNLTFPIAAAFAADNQIKFYFEKPVKKEANRLNWLNVHFSFKIFCFVLFPVFNHHHHLFFILFVHRFIIFLIYFAIISLFFAMFFKF